MNGYIEDITRFIFVEDAPEQADVILVCGSARTEPALRAAALYGEGFAPRVLPTGRFGERFGSFREEMRRFAENDQRNAEEVFAEIQEQAARAGVAGFPETEWAYQRNVLLAAGVPEQAILCEDRSVNTFENAIFARHLLREKGIEAKTMILCCQAFHARRAMMTFATEFPDARILICPAVTRGISRESWHTTADGYDKVLDELQKCGSYFRGGRMYRAFSEKLPASDIKRSGGGGKLW